MSEYQAPYSEDAIDIALEAAWAANRAFDAIAGQKPHRPKPIFLDGSGAKTGRAVPTIESSLATYMGDHADLVQIFEHLCRAAGVVMAADQPFQTWD